MPLFHPATLLRSEMQMFQNISGTAVLTNQIGLKTFPRRFLINNESVNLDITKFLHAQFHSRQHKHADESSVIYFANKTNSPGTFTYQYDSRTNVL